MGRENRRSDVRTDSFCGEDMNHKTTNEASEQRQQTHLPLLKQRSRKDTLSP
jgi:hypothetical protein